MGFLPAADHRDVGQRPDELVAKIYYTMRFAPLFAALCGEIRTGVANGVRSRLLDGWGIGGIILLFCEKTLILRYINVKTPNVMKTKLFTLLIVALAAVQCATKQPSADTLSLSELIGQSSPEQVEAWYNGASRIDEEDVATNGAQIRDAKRLVIFDLDGTLSDHRTALPDESRALLDALKERYHIAMCGAGNAPRIFKQMGGYPIDIVGNYGKQQAEVRDGELVIVREDCSEVDRDFFLKETARLREKYGYTHYYGEPVEFHKSGMVTFGLLGTDAPKSEKSVFDTDRAKRRAMYPEVLQVFADYAVFIGGSTSFDIVEKQYNKYDAAMRYAREHGYTKEQVLFVGDDMGDGGGDHHVRLGGMDYVHITDYTKVAERLAFLLE